MRELDSTAAAAERIFNEMVKARQIRATFSITEGSPDLLAGMAGVDDILVMVQPQDGAEHFTYQYGCLLKSYLDASAALLIFPTQPTSARP